MSDAKTAEQLWLKAHEEVKKGNLAQAVRDLAKCYEMLKALKDPRLAQVHGRWVEVHKLYQARKAKAQAAAAAATPEQHAAAQQRAAAEQAAQEAARRQQVEAARLQAEAAARAKAEAKERAEAEARARAEQEARAAAQAAEAAAAVVAEPRFSDSSSGTLEQRAEAAANAGDLPGAVGLYEQIVASSPGNELAVERLAELRAAASRADSYSSGAANAAPGDDPQAQVAFLEGLLGRIQERRRSA